MRRKIKNRIFEILKEISESKEHNGLLVVFSNLNKIFARGAIPLGKRKKELNVVGNIMSENISEILKKVGDDGAVLIEKNGDIYSPSVYLNVNVLGLDEGDIEPEFCARHIAALATSKSTKAAVYTLSEETGKVREFIKGKIKKQHPKQELSMDKIITELEKENMRKKIIHTERFKNFIVHRILRR